MKPQSMTADEAASEYRKLDVYACDDVDPILARAERMEEALREIADSYVSREHVERMGTGATMWKGCVCIAIDALAEPDA